MTNSQPALPYDIMWFSKLAFVFLGTLGMIFSISAATKTDSRLVPLTATWVVDPAIPGDDLPPVGRSLFDFLITQGQGKVVPFPFKRLMQSLNAEVSNQAHKQGLQSVLIPLGRSLQRGAAAPDFFASPREIVISDHDAAPRSRMLLKDKIYLAYQPRAATIEVISYNEAAGRFEFQVVKDYRATSENTAAGIAPKIYYAKRTLCMACHQNAGPIFSRQVWDETNANPRIAVLLQQQHKDFDGIAIEAGIDVPNAIDNAKLRANRYALSQLLWREACAGNEAAQLAAQVCRARLFTAVLQYKLSGAQQFDRGRMFMREAATPIRNHSQSHWPNGLALGNPDLPNRDPLNVMTREAMSDITARFDPLVLREPLEILRLPATENEQAWLESLIEGLAEFVSEQDVDLLLRALNRERNSAVATTTLATACHVVSKPIDTQHARVDFQCPASSTPNTFSMRGQFETTSGRIVGGRIDSLDLANQGRLHSIDLNASNFQLHDGIDEAALVLSRKLSGTPPEVKIRAVRGADGQVITQLRLHWSSAHIEQLSAELLVEKDFDRIEQAIQSLLQQAAKGRFDGFDALPFRRARLMPALLEQFGVKMPEPCCLDTSRLPPAQREPQAAALVTDSKLRPFFQYCATCHQGKDSAPPNFLQGDVATVQSNLNRCAERIYVRLAMWAQTPAARVKSPMPPAPSLHALGIDALHWPNGAERLAMSADIGALIQKHSGDLPGVEALLANGYEHLPACATERPH